MAPKLPIGCPLVDVVGGANGEFAVCEVDGTVRVFPDWPDGSVGCCRSEAEGATGTTDSRVELEAAPAVSNVVEDEALERPSVVLGVTTKQSKLTFFILFW